MLCLKEPDTGYMSGAGEDAFGTIQLTKGASNEVPLAVQ